LHVVSANMTTTLTLPTTDSVNCTDLTVFIFQIQLFSVLYTTLFIVKKPEANFDTIFEKPLSNEITIYKSHTYL